jgi:hypothetical protein
MPDSRNNSGQFKPGQSGNPGGKSPEREALRRSMTKHTPEMLEIILEIARTARSEKVRLEAASYWVDQDLGKALVAIAGEDGAPLKVDAKVLHERVLDIVAKASKRT